ncbi:hypothetical protein DFH08DRAFT_946898 [Mycena albidolilacea]|uniref:DUF6534 domain-containing protein n=1 Tax=Mycena albidolilacea TaxID=1033008 RepID=A0AAD7ATY6_9AGAR|nr:hypothetical protein DFH08DRAFT_946898 [Mycena albidolilacea]
MASASSAAAAAQLAALTSAVKELFATTFIGFTVATTLYGVSILQVYLYFRRYSQDRWTLKTMVATLWILDTLTTIFVAHSLFVFVFGLLSKKADTNIPWGFTVEKMLVTIITFIAQCFYAHTIWKVSKNILTTVFVSVLAVATFGLGIYTTVHLFQNPGLNSISSRSFLIVSGLVQGLAALNDIVITASLSYYLHIKRSGLPSSEKLIDTLIVYAVSRGVLTAVAQIMFLVLNVAMPHHQYWLPFHLVVGKLYINSVLASLNVRSSLSRTEIMLGPGISALRNNEQMDERDETVTKPIAFVPMGVAHPPASSFGTFSRGSVVSDAERG